MKKVYFNIMVSEDMEIKSMDINFEHKTKPREVYNHNNVVKRQSRISFNPKITEEPDEVFLYDELY